jgi:hypothetical protein
MIHLFEVSSEDELNTLLLIFGFLVANMKSMNESQIIHPFVGSILSWIRTDGQCLAALHSYISTLKPDRADSTFLGVLEHSKIGTSGADLITEKSAVIPKPVV